MGQYWTKPDQEQVKEQSKKDEKGAPAPAIIESCETKNNVKLAKFDMKAVMRNRAAQFWIIIGKRGMGSTTLAEDIVRHQLDSLDQKSVSLLVFNSTQEFRPRYQEIKKHAYVKDSLIVSEYSEDILDEKVSKHTEVLETNPDRHLFLVFDECFYDSMWQKSTTIREAVYNGRYLNITVIICLQYAMGLNIGLRNNADYVAVFRDTVTNQARLYDYFFNDCFKTSTMFSQVMNQVCGNPGDCLICDVVKSTPAWYRAEVS